MKKPIKTIALILALGVLAVAGFMVVKIGPRNIIGLLRYDQRKEGPLKVGDRAPDVTVTALDGAPRPLLSAAGSAGRPTVLIFGSYT